MRFSLVFAHDLAADALDRIAALARIASYGRMDVTGDGDATVAALFGVAASGIAPIAALGAGVEARDAYVLRADPVTFVAGRDDVLLAGRVEDLTVAESTALVDMLNRHFAGDGVAFHAPRANAWFITVAGRDVVPVDTDPLRYNEPIATHLPRGAHGATWRRWLSEMQMLLHEHPVNVAREAAGRALANGIWVSGGGTLPHTLPALRMKVHAMPSRAGDIATGFARLADVPVAAVPVSFEALPRDDDAVVVLPDSDDVDALSRHWLSPALAALERGGIDMLTILAIDGKVRRYESARPSWWRRMRRDAR